MDVAVSVAVAVAVAVTVFVGVVAMIETSTGRVAAAMLSAWRQLTNCVPAPSKTIAAVKLPLAAALTVSTTAPPTTISIVLSGWALPTIGMASPTSTCAFSTVQTTGTGVLVGVAVSVDVLVGAGVYVDVLVGIGVAVSVDVLVGAGVCVDVLVGTGVAVSVDVAVGIGVAVSVGVAVGVAVAVFVAVAVGVGATTVKRSCAEVSRKMPLLSTTCTLYSPGISNSAVHVHVPSDATTTTPDLAPSTRICSSTPGCPVPVKRIAPVCRAVAKSAGSKVGPRRVGVAVGTVACATMMGVAVAKRASLVAVAV